METQHCETLEELKVAIQRYGPGVLYRGQTQHYLGSNGLPSLSTSFQRQGCVPDLMIKWTYYAKRALQHLVRGWKETDDTATNQAILQHYGFRSFFLDASGDPRVAAWFASNRFESKIAVNLVEDCFEDPVWLRTRNAWFVPTEDIGHLYLISQKSLRRSGIQAVHLSEIATDQGAPRYVRQDAYMVGPLIQSGLSSDCILCHITAPAEVLRNFAGDIALAGYSLSLRMTLYIASCWRCHGKRCDTSRMTASKHSGDHWSFQSTPGTFKSICHLGARCIDHSGPGIFLLRQIARPRPPRKWPSFYAVAPCITELVRLASSFRRSTSCSKSTTRSLSSWMVLFTMGWTHNMGRAWES
ncbi:hypothetical protein C4K29_5069 [Pseudomonas chlororaphis subsp. piscium]|nr:hypothetical protein C4K29_5069 [Pseudomonas chlororaphis subsp. piscium]